MKRGWFAAVAALAALAVGIGVTDGLDSGSTPVVAFVTGSASSAPVVWLANVDGSDAHLLGGGSQPLLAPDGSVVAASTAPGFVLYSTSGGGPHRYFEGADATAVAVAFSHDSRYVAVVLSSTDPASAAGSGLAVIDITRFSYRIIAHGQIYGASFAPNDSDRLAYASAASSALSASVDVHVVGANGVGAAQITNDGRSLNPVWGPDGIAFDHERVRRNAEPAYQVWLMTSDGTARRPVTALAIPPLREGLVPISFSGDGHRLLAEYQGLDTNQAWLLTLPGGHATPLGADLTGAALSRDGTSALVDRGGFPNSDSAGVVESLPLAGGQPRALAAHASEPSWDA
jgi:hypothetical protein